MANELLATSDLSEKASGDVRSNQDLRNANRHLHEFLDLLGHELRSPLGAIRSALSVLELRGDDAITREWGLSMMLRQAESIGRLVEDMLEVSRIEHGKIQLCKQPLDLAHTVSRAIETARGALEGRGHQIRIALPHEPMILHADPARLEQVVTNLLNNAAKYMKPGGCVWVTAKAQDGEAEVRVRDSGIGIEPEMLPHVFDPFWQAKRTFDPSESGLGIGLALVRKLVDLHGGSVSAQSPGLGHGSEFILRLPVQAEAAASGVGGHPAPQAAAFST